MEKHLIKVFSTKAVCLSLASILALGFGMPSCKKEASEHDFASVEESKKSKVDSREDDSVKQVAADDAEESVVSSSEAALKDTSAVVLTFADGSTLTRTQVEKVATDMLAQSPYGNIKISDLPAAIYDGLIEQVVNAKIIAHWANKTGVYGQSDFKEEVSKLVEMVKEMKAQEYFLKDLKNQSAKPSDKEVESYYNQNLKNYLKSAGGTTTAMVSCDSRDLAQEFLAALSTDGKANTVESMKALQAELKTGEYKSFGKITQDMLDGNQKASPYGFPKPTAPEGVLGFVRGAKKYPATGIVGLDGDKFAVVLCSDSSDDVYYTLAEVKSHVAQLLEQEAMQKSFKTGVDKISKKYVSKDSRAVLARPKSKGGKESSQENMMAQLMAGMQGGADSGAADGLQDADLQEALKGLEGMDEESLNKLAQSLGEAQGK